MVCVSQVQPAVIDQDHRPALDITGPVAGNASSSVGRVPRSVLGGRRFDSGLAFSRKHAMRFGSLFCGIGGFDLGLERAGMQCAWQVEIDPYAQKVLAKHWPDVRRHADVCTFPPQEGDWEVDVICGGFPCQDISYAGKGAGLAGARSGLWYEFARIIGKLRPRYVIVENVSALLTRGMGEVIGTLATLGYDAEWHVIPASAVGAPHRRDRVWIVGIRSGDGCEAVPQRPDADIVGPHRAEMHLVGGSELRDKQERDAGSVRPAVPDADRRQVRGVNADAGDGGTLPQQGAERIVRGIGRGDDVPDPKSKRRRERRPRGVAGSRSWQEDAAVVADASFSGLADRQGQPSNARQERSPFERGGWWATEPDVGRVAHGVPARVDRLRCLGNAVVPQVVELIGRAIMERERGE